jgi:hypothetical protein
VEQRRLVARSRFFSWSRDRTENRIPLFLITLQVDCFLDGVPLP